MKVADCFVSTIRKHKVLFLGLILGVVFSVIVSLLPPLLLEVIVNHMIQKKQVSVGLGLGYFGLVALGGILDAVRESEITIMGQKMIHELRGQMCHKLLRLPASFYRDQDPGRTTSLFVNDVETVETLFDNGVISMVTDFARVIGILGMIFWKSLGLGLLLLLILPLLYWFTRSFQKRMKKAQQRNRQAVAEGNGFVPETIRNSSMIRSFHKENYMEEAYDKLITKSYRAIEKSNLYDSVYSPLIVSTSAFVIGIMMVLAAMGGDFRELFGMSAGAAVAVIAYVGKIFDPLESIGMEIQNIQSAAAGIGRIQEFFNREDKAEPEQAAEYETNGQQNEVTFQNVTFAYQEQEDVLKNLSFSVSKGERVTLRGTTGAGKTTIFRLVLGEYEPDKGIVLLQGRQPGSITSQEKRSRYGYVEQTFQPVPGSIEDQIALYDTEIPLEKIRDSLNKTGLEELVDKLPDGLQTPFTQAGFSQGQRQLLAIARAIVCESELLLLDEITANLDTQTEAKVRDAILQSSENRTVLSISHRLSEQINSRIIEIKLAVD